MNTPEAIARYNASAPTHEQLRSLLRYEPGTGIFTWLVNRPAGVKAGSKAGALDRKGYVRIKVLGKLYWAHRLAWLYMTGSMPPNFIDHIDGRPDNNVWGNLRLATNSQNQACRTKWNNRTSGIRGVTWHKKIGKWQAQIRVNGHNKYLGVFPTKEDAASAYQSAARTYFGEFAPLDGVNT